MTIRHALTVLALLMPLAASAQWVRQPAPSNDELYEVVALTDQRLVTVGRDGTILQTENAGATWTLRDDTNPFAEAFRAASAVDALFVAAVTEYGDLYKSLDGGLTWARAGGIPVPFGDFFAYDVHFRSRTDGWIVGADFLPPYDDFMWHTTDGGATWTSVFLFENSRSQLLYVDFEGERGWAGSDGGTFFRTTDGGATWTEGALPSPGVGIDVLDMEFASDGLTGFAGGWDRYLARSTDGGVTWTLLDFEIGAIKFSDFHLRSPTDVWASTYFPSFGGYDDGIVYHSTDGGQTATYEEVGADPGAAGSFSGIVGTDSRAFIVGFGGFIYTREVDPITAPVAVSATPVGGPVVIGPGGGSFEFTVTLTNTTEQAQAFEAWTSVTGAVSREPVLGPLAVTLPPNATVTRTLTQRVPGSAPAGAYTYAVNVGDFPGTVAASASFPLVKAGSEAAVQGAADGGAAPAGGWSASGWDDAGASVAALPGGPALSEVHPNPFASAARVTVGVTEAQAVRVEVFDALGRRVAVLHEGPLAAGTHALALDGSSWPAGVYVVRATGEALAASRRAVIVR